MPRSVWAIPCGFALLVLGSGSVWKARLSADPPPSQSLPSQPPSLQSSPRQATVGRPDLAALETQRRQQREDGWRAFMTDRGVSERQTQDAIIAHLWEQDKARRAVLDAGRRLLPMLGGRGRATPKSEQVQTSVEAYEKALSQYALDRRQAEAALDEKVHYAKDERLKALLLVLGAIGSGPPILPL